ncbi:hypothetical protein EOD41_07375 [Mucilaginibacter limnophilus]|uniref:Carboxypeptidase-like regulatory domain-containing protein n=1 Tax=Mucilaginibacter limnophilus TaxID=1932778 RepID=A0A437MVT0_9SPHI|nr:hypothetical protein [Mucilaginibacter limnophilus]RVU01772.1 hypothetical protein EOD41_07375 [Mucilaginibacter limnophilus]
MRLIYFWLLFLLFLIPGETFAQQVRGMVFKQNSSLRLSQTQVANLKTNTKVLTDNLGIFTINATPGDTLLFTKTGYTAVKQVVVNQLDIAVYMPEAKVIQLDEVSVKAQSKQQELSDVMKDYRGKGTFFDGKPPALLFLNSPLTGLYELFGRTPKNAAHFKRFAQKELEQNEINKRYNKEFVKRITGITTDAEAQRFIDTYSPNYEDLKTWNDYDLVKRTKRWYEHYKKGQPPVKGLQ